MSRLALTVPAAATLLLAGCVSHAPSEASAPLTVSSSADDCLLSAQTAPSGTISFAVTNDGPQVTEFYLLAADGLRVVSELENIGPGLTRTLVVQVPAGDYTAVCKPGMIGDGISVPFTVTGDGSAVGPTGDRAEQLDSAAASYVAYVRNEVEALLSETEAFTDAYVAGNDDEARSLYPLARMHYERIEPVAESFGDLDPLLDLREADLEEGQTWSGWHYIEKDLWPPASYALAPEQRSAAAADLNAWTQQLYDQVHADGFTVEAFQISNGAKELLDEVAFGKITGEEEIWSHTDLWDFVANVQGAKVAYEVLADVVSSEDPDLAADLTTRFETLETTLATYGSPDDGFTLYTDLTTEQVKELSAQVDALGEPLSQLTTTVTGA
jgi:iron uptake system component EfeO